MVTPLGRAYGQEVAGGPVELEADEVEVLAHADLDVPETILNLLEQQVKEISANAPCGVIAALA